MHVKAPFMVRVTLADDTPLTKKQTHQLDTHIQEASNENRQPYRIIPIIGREETKPNIIPGHKNRSPFLIGFTVSSSCEKHCKHIAMMNGVDIFGNQSFLFDGKEPT